MSCEAGCLTGVTIYEKTQIFNRIRRKLGAPIMGVELVDEQIEECICEAIEEYSSFINNWAMENKLAEMLGLPTTNDFTLKYITNSLYFEKSMTNTASEMIGGGVSTTRELFTTGITLSSGTQNYNIPDTHEIQDVLWYTPNFVNMYGFDGANFAYTEFGASFAGYNLYSVLPVFDTVLTSSAAKQRNKVRGYEYSYAVFKGPPGYRTIRLYPIPNASGNTTNFNGIANYYGTPGTVFYRFFLRPDNYVAGNPELGLNSIGITGQTQGNGLVSGPADAPLYNLNYSLLNDVAKTWVKKYAQALAKELLGLGIRGKFSGVLPIPDAEVTMNSADLITNGRADKELYLEQLKTTLDALNLQKLLEDRASMQESVNKTLQTIPLGIYFG